MLASVLLSLLLGCVSASSSAYYGKKLGYFSTLEHAVSGLIYAVDSKTIHIRGFNYDGQAPDAYFYVGLGRTPSGRGTKVPAENGSTKPLRRYRDENLTLTLPKGTTLDQVQWISVWCHDYSVDFGNLVLSKPVSDYPRPQKIGRFTTRENGVKSSQAVVVDSKTLLIPDFNYNGEGPDAHFWAGVGKEPAADGFIVPNENGNHQPLASYDHKTIVLTLPGDVTVFDIDYLGVWCESYGANFGHLAIDHRYLNVPPSLRVLGVRPQSDYGSAAHSSDKGRLHFPSYQPNTQYHSRQGAHHAPTTVTHLTTRKPVFSVFANTNAQYGRFGSDNSSSDPRDHGDHSVIHQQPSPKPAFFPKHRPLASFSQHDRETSAPVWSSQAKPIVTFSRRQQETTQRYRYRPSFHSESTSSPSTSKIIYPTRGSGTNLSPFGRDTSGFDTFRTESVDFPKRYYSRTAEKSAMTDSFAKLTRAFNSHGSDHGTLGSSVSDTRHTATRFPSNSVKSVFSRESTERAPPSQFYSDTDHVIGQEQLTTTDPPSGSGSYSHFSIGDGKVVSIRYRL